MWAAKVKLGDTQLWYYWISISCKNWDQYKIGFKLKLILAFLVTVKQSQNKQINPANNRRKRYENSTSKCIVQCTGDKSEFETLYKILTFLRSYFKKILNLAAKLSHIHITQLQIYATTNITSENCLKAHDINYTEFWQFNFILVLVMLQSLS